MFPLITRFLDTFSPLPMFCEILHDGQSLKPHKVTQEKAKKMKFIIFTGSRETESPHTKKGSYERQC